MKKFFAIFLTAFLIFSFCSCNDKAESEQGDFLSENTASFEQRGSGAKEFYLTVCFESGEQAYYKINTDKETVGQALGELGIISGEQGPYGLYILTVDGETHKYEDDGKFWAFYDGDDMATKGVDKTEIKHAGSYSLKVQAG